jgi:2-amino-4-hydroxy-6-hydroxymethyldihydropteridine diphosphokinase
MEQTETTVFLGLGSNRGDRATWLCRAVEGLAATDQVSGVRLSPVYETAAIGAAGPERFLNAVVEIRTTLPPDQLLTRVQVIEQLLERGPDRTAARTIDIDILLYGELVCESETLTIPHPRMHERDFVLIPLSDFAPAIKHPVTGATITELLDRLQDRDSTLMPYDFEPKGGTNAASRE